MPQISSCLWFDSQGEQAAKFYTTVFKHAEIGATAKYGEAASKLSGQKQGAVMTVDFKLEDYKIMALNGGPIFKPNPSMSLTVSCESEAEINEKWKKLSAGGTVRMELNKYPWAERYGWAADQYGVEWQLILTPLPYKIVPSMLFVDALFGKGEEAINFYLSIFPKSKIVKMTKNEQTKTVAHCLFEIGGHGVALMEGEGKHGHKFNEAHSLVVGCDTQAEIDHIYGSLLKGGAESQCGWVTDKYGVCWQVVPSQLSDWMKDPARANRIMEKVGKMKKLDLEVMKNA